MSQAGSGEKSQGQVVMGDDKQPATWHKKCLEHACALELGAGLDDPPEYTQVTRWSKTKDRALLPGEVEED